MDMSWQEWSMIDRGYEIRYEKQLDIMRNIIATQINTAMGSKKKVSPKSVLQLPFVDTSPAKEFKRVKSSSIEAALKRLNNDEDKRN